MRKDTKIAGTIGIVLILLEIVGVVLAVEVWHGLMF